MVIKLEGIYGIYMNHPKIRDHLTYSHSSLGLINKRGHVYQAFRMQTHSLAYTSGARNALSDQHFAPTILFLLGVRKAIFILVIYILLIFGDLIIYHTL